jgi:hypothetical protein
MLRNAFLALRYCGGAKMLLVLELGGRLDGLEVPVMVEGFDLDARTWIKLRLAPMCATLHSDGCFVTVARARALGCMGFDLGAPVGRVFAAWPC